jgi:ankyrin repeat protein
MTQQTPTQTPTVTATDKEQRDFVINCWNNQKDKVIDVLAQRPDAIHWRDPESRNTGLSYAVASGSMAYDVAQILLQCKADVNVQDCAGETPLMNAASGASEAYVDLLLAHGADVTLRNNEGKTARDIAEDKGNSWIVKMFDKHEARHAAEIAAAEAAQELVAKQEMARDISKLQTGSTAPVTVRKPLQFVPKNK